MQLLANGHSSRFCKLSSEIVNATRGLNTIQIITARAHRVMEEEDTVKQQSYLTRATTLLPEHNLLSSRENVTTVAPQTLYRTACQPTLCPHLIVKGGSKANPAHILTNLAAETIDTYPNTMTHVYTDGSALNAVVQAGYGLTMQCPDATRKAICET